LTLKYCTKISTFLEKIDNKVHLNRRSRIEILSNESWFELKTVAFSYKKTVLLILNLLAKSGSFKYFIFLIYFF
jgi:hypothetical protein